MDSKAKFVTLYKRQNIDAGLTVEILQHKKSDNILVLANLATVKARYARAGSYCREIWKLCSGLTEANYVAGLMLDNPWPMLNMEKPDHE